MTLKQYLMAFVVIGVMAIPQGKAELGLGVLSGLLGLINIEGTVFCTYKDNMSLKGVAIPVFPNAKVQVVCGGKEYSNGATDDDGTFSIKMDPLLLDLSSLLSDCNIVVVTPLSNCNANLPSAGVLISTLNFVGITRLATRTIIANITPSGFHFVPST
ncbi:hypothetical protein CR513_43097, partial [Mucuna pruriens]